MTAPTNTAAPARVTGAGSSRGRRRITLAAFVLLFVLPLALRLWPIGHGMPRNYVPDTHVVRSALGMLRDRDPVPPVGRYSTYPNLIPYLLVPVYAGHFAAGMASGAWSGPAEYGEAVTEDPSTVHLLARILVALLGALTPWVVFRLAREVGLARGAWVAALLVGAGLLHVHFSVQERPWVPMTFFMALAAWAGAVHARRGDARSLLLSGGAAGLAFACHQAGLLAAGITALSWACSTRRWRGAEVRGRLLAGLGSALAFLALGLLLGHPYLLVYGPTGTDAVVGGDAVDVSVGGQGIRFSFRPESAVRLATVFVAYDPVLALLGLLGLVAALRHRGARPATLFLIAWALFFGTQANDKIRYLLPVAVLLALPAGFAAERLARGRAGVVLVALLLALPLALCVRFGRVLSRLDTRAIVERELPALLPAGARLAVDRYGPALELDAASLRRLADLRERTGSELYTREAARYERLLAGAEPDPGLDAVVLRELFEFGERDTDFLEQGVHVREGLEPLGRAPRDVLRATGATHLLLVNRLGVGGDRHLLADWISAREPLAVFDPWEGPPRLGGARLPMEMELPVLSLWTLERPGPWMALYALD